MSNLIIIDESNDITKSSEIIETVSNQYKKEIDNELLFSNSEESYNDKKIIDLHFSSKDHKSLITNSQLTTSNSTVEHVVNSNLCDIAILKDLHLALKENARNIIENIPGNYTSWIYHIQDCKSILESLCKPKFKLNMFLDGSFHNYIKETDILIYNRMKTFISKHVSYLASCVTKASKSYQLWNVISSCYLPAVPESILTYSMLKSMLDEEPKNHNVWGYLARILGNPSTTISYPKGFIATCLDLTSYCIKKDLRNGSAWHFRDLILQKLYSYYESLNDIETDQSAIYDGQIEALIDYDNGNNSQVIIELLKAAYSNILPAVLQYQTKYIPERIIQQILIEKNTDYTKLTPVINFQGLSQSSSINWKQDIILVYDTYRKSSLLRRNKLHTIEIKTLGGLKNQLFAELKNLEIALDTMTIPNNDTEQILENNSSKILFQYWTNWVEKLISFSKANEDKVADILQQYIFTIICRDIPIMLVHTPYLQINRRKKMKSFLSLIRDTSIPSITRINKHSLNRLIILRELQLVILILHYASLNVPPVYYCNTLINHSLTFFE